MRFRIVYCMNVDWDWAKQRPHFIAQHLSRSHELIILYPFASRRSNLSRNERDGLRPIPFFRIPFGSRLAFIRRLNSLLLRVAAIAFFNRSKPDIVWISSPELSEYLPAHLSSKLIYDCMDDVLAFPSNGNRKAMLAEKEKVLLGRSAHVFCSSENLREKLIVRAGHSEKYSVVRNAFEPSAFSRHLHGDKKSKRGDTYILGYIGTISSWMDFDALLKVANEFPSVVIHLIGPVENLGKALPAHERIRHMGAVKHSEIQARASEFDALIMPFKVTDLIQSVDPVKLYEYIFFNKPIVSVRYKEIERFENFVDFYSDEQELLSIVARYVNGGFSKSYTCEAREQFLAENTWACRVKYIEDKLLQLEPGKS